MGLSFLNLNCRLGTQQVGEGEGRVLNAVDLVLRENGYVRTEAPRADDRTITVTRRGREPWISVFDSGCGMKMERLTELGDRLSRALGEPVVGACVYDGDLLELAVIKHPDGVSSLAAYGDYFGEAHGDPTPHPPIALAHLWHDLAPEPQRAAALRRALRGRRRRFDAVAVAARALGFGRDLTGLPQHGAPILYPHATVVVHFRPAGKRRPERGRPTAPPLPPSPPSTASPPPRRAAPPTRRRSGR